MDALRDGGLRIPPIVGVALLLVTLGLIVGTATYLAPIDPALTLTYESHGNGTLDITVENPKGRVALTNGAIINGETHATLVGNDTARITNLSEGDAVTVMLNRGRWGYVTTLKYAPNATGPITMTFEIQDAAIICHPSATHLCY